jgi:amino acid transporter
MNDDLLTIIGMVICLIFIIYLGINYFKISEGIDSEGGLVTSPTGTLTPEVVAKNIGEEKDKIFNLLNIKTHKASYEDIVSNLIDYYDNLILLTIVGATKDKNDNYNIGKIAQYKSIKDTLIDANGFLESSK